MVKTKFKSLITLVQLITFKQYFSSSNLLPRFSYSDLMADTETFSPENWNTCEDLEIFGDDSGKIKTFAFSLDGIVTDVAVCDYGDKQLIIITQLQKIGTLISVTKGCARNLNGISDIYDIKTICGEDNPDFHLATRYLVEQLNISKPVVFGICLKNVSVTTLKSIAKALKENLGL